MDLDGTWKDWKRDPRPAKGEWSPGYFIRRCTKCGIYFQGDKLALDCAPCAYGDGAESGGKKKAAA